VGWCRWKVLTLRAWLFRSGWLLCWVRARPFELRARIWNGEKAARGLV